MQANISRGLQGQQHVCSKCGKFFTAKRSLVTHIKTHSGEKPFACDVCQKAFARNGDLTRHKKTHTGEKPFTCNACQKKFILSSDLKLDMNVHAPKTCDQCGIQVSMKSELLSHIRVTHQPKRKETGIAVGC